MDARAAAGADTGTRPPTSASTTSTCTIRSSGIAATGTSTTCRAISSQGADGFHGVCRRSVPAAAIRQFQRAYPFGRAGVLSETPPVSRRADRREPRPWIRAAARTRRSRSRYYVQRSLSETGGRVAGTSRFWPELQSRLAATPPRGLVTGPSIDKSIAPLRSFVAEPMRFGRLFLAGDAAHSRRHGRQGPDLAASDVHYLSSALVEFYQSGSGAGIASYSSRALARVWQAERFSWWMMHAAHSCPTPGRSASACSAPSWSISSAPRPLKNRSRRITSAFRTSR